MIWKWNKKQTKQPTSEQASDRTAVNGKDTLPV